MSKKIEHGDIAMLIHGNSVRLDKNTAFVTKAPDGAWVIKADTIRQNNYNSSGIDGRVLYPIARFDNENPESEDSEGMEVSIGVVDQELREECIDLRIDPDGITCDEALSLAAALIQAVHLCRTGECNTKLKIK